MLGMHIINLPCHITKERKGQVLMDRVTEQKSGCGDCGVETTDEIITGTDQNELHDKGYSYDMIRKFFFNS